MIPSLKALHIAALTIWCAGLLCMPPLLVQHANERTQEGFATLRQFVRRIYVFVMTPAAVVAVAAGTGLIFARGVFLDWMFVKLAVVGLLVALHAFQGHLLHQLGGGSPICPRWQGAAMTGGGLALITTILFLVLAKPPLTDAFFPAWLLRPRGHSLATPI